MSRWIDRRPDRYAEAVAHDRAGRLAEAAAAYRRLAAIWPGHRALIRYNLASVLARQGRAARAARFFTAIADDPDAIPALRAGAHFHLGRLADTQGQAVAARDHYRATLVIAPGHAGARAALAEPAAGSAVDRGASLPRMPQRRRPRAAAADGPVLVYQMGKVGSNSVYAGLRAALPSVEVHHSHLLAPRSFAHYERWFALDSALPEPLVSSTREQIAAGRRLRERVLGDGPRWRIVCLTREPMAHLLSVLFHHLEVYTRLSGAGSPPRLDALHGFAVEALRAWAGRPTAVDPDPARAALTLASRWFDEEPADVLGLDVHASAFPFERGYLRRRTVRADVVVLRVEDLGWAAPDAMRALCGVGTFALPDENRAEDRPSGPLYAEYLRACRFPAGLVDAVYATRYARHFYRDDERAALRARWSEGRA